MKKFYVLTLFAFISTIAKCQFNISMTGARIQLDSCTYYSSFQLTNVTITSASGKDMNIVLLSHRLVQRK